MRIRPETSRMGSADMRFQLSKNSVQAVDRPDLPSQGQYIAPMAIRMKQRLEQNVVGFPKSPFEPRKPMVRNRRDGFCSSQHSRSQAIDLRGVSRLYTLPSLPHLRNHVWGNAQPAEDWSAFAREEECEDGCRGDVDLHVASCACDSRVRPARFRVPSNGMPLSRR